jgi:hypothetical protein
MSLLMEAFQHVDESFHFLCLVENLAITFFSKMANYLDNNILEVDLTSVRKGT